ncbi:hypothetical protein VCHA50P415_230013 [Vibrio chagasii]|nr:hypothetical protein VCHA36P168_230012 [Vibrio chagasii]CAH6879988.1 hypothetical protein VCHA35P150_260019 [Vibrio chagasii]CAH6918463.1 hypothetical protein VCHA31O73_380010 [Vibrio chagasii]CAH6961675.1 hypothetical protein VCHA35O141_400037 [Vibrio chagasii]CAH6965388.1 hypothetical protein VCHA35O143_400033 [Vibrio chagasii]
MCTTLSIFLSSEFITESLFVSKSMNLDLACPRLDTMTLSLTISFTKPKNLVPPIYFISLAITRNDQGSKTLKHEYTIKS